MVPNASLTVILIAASQEGKETKDAAYTPIYGEGSLSLDIPPLFSTLDVAVNPEEEIVKPGSRTSVYTTVCWRGKPVENAVVSFVVVCLYSQFYQLTV